MKYFVDDLSLATATSALAELEFGYEPVEDSRGVCYVTIWTEANYEGQKGAIGGFIVGSLHRELGMFATYTLTMTEHCNDRARISQLLSNLLARTSIR